MEGKFPPHKRYRNDAVSHTQSRFTNKMENVTSVSDAWWRIIAFAVADIAIRQLAQTRAGILVSLLAAAACVILLCLNRGLFLVWFTILIIIFGDITPQISSGRSPFDPLPPYYSIHSFHVGPFTLVNYIFLLAVFYVVVRTLQRRRVRFSKGLVLLLAVIASSACIGIVNLVEDESALSYYISDLGPLAAYFVYYTFTRMTVLDLKADPELIIACTVDCLRGKAVAYAVQWLIRLAKGLGWITVFARDTLTFAAVICAIMYPLVVGRQTRRARLVNVLTAIAGIMMFVGQPGSAQMIYTIIGFMIVVCVIFAARRTRGVFVTLVSTIAVVTVIVGLSYATSIGLVPVAPLIGWKIQNVLSLISGDSVAPTVSVRIAEFENIVTKLRHDGILALIAGEGAGSYFEFLYTQPPSSIYEVAGAYSAAQLKSGKFYRPHDFVNANLLTCGFLGLALYMAFFARETLQYVKKTISLAKQSSSLTTWSLLYLSLLPGIMYNTHWSTKVATFSGVFSALVYALVSADIEKSDDMRGR